MEFGFNRLLSSRAHGKLLFRTAGHGRTAKLRVMRSTNISFYQPL